MIIKQTYWNTRSFRVDIRLTRLLSIFIFTQVGRKNSFTEIITYYIVSFLSALLLKSFHFLIAVPKNVLNYVFF